MGLRALLDRAKGRSEHVIIAFCDIRGFSEFSSSKGRESTDVAMLIKRFYIKLLDEYFPTADFVKPTGDGLLLIFEYSVDDLGKIADRVIRGAAKCLEEFPGRFFAADPMINFEPPQRLGFGITRGSACCLYSGKERLDYSGHLLNLAARLNDYARPQGIVIDGNFMLNVIPQDLRGRFEASKVFVRGIAETEPGMQVLYTKDLTVLPEYALHPLVGEQWVRDSKKFKLYDLKRMEGTFSLRLTAPPVSKSKVKVHVVCDHKDLKDHELKRPYPFQYLTDSRGAYIRIDPGEAIEFARGNHARNEDEISFRAEYVPDRTKQ